MAIVFGLDETITGDVIMDIMVVVMAPSFTLPAAVYGPFETKHKAWLFIEDKLNQQEGDKQLAFVVRNYGIPNDPISVR